MVHAQILHIGVLLLRHKRGNAFLHDLRRLCLHVEDIISMCNTLSCTLATAQACLQSLRFELQCSLNPGTMDESSTENICIKVEDEMASINLVDNAVVRLPTQVLSRSTVLHQAVTDTGAPEETYRNICLPVGVIRSWVMGLQALGVHSQRREPFPDETPPFKRPRHGFGVLESLKVRCPCQLT